MSQTRDIVIQCNVQCRPQGAVTRYRAWVGSELFAERTWQWGDQYYLEETLVIRAEPGQYNIRYELVPGDQGQITANHFRVLEGPASVTPSGLVEIR